MVDFVWLVTKRPVVGRYGELFQKTWFCFSFVGALYVQRDYFQIGRRVDKLKMKKTQYALFPSLIHQVIFVLIQLFSERTSFLCGIILCGIVHIITEWTKCKSSIRNKNSGKVKVFFLYKLFNIP